MRDRQTCVDCGRSAPETETDYTLISSRFGWRLTREHLPDGTMAIEWRCPTCFRVHKERKLAGTAPPSWPGASARDVGPLPPPPPSRSGLLPRTLPPEAAPDNDDTQRLALPRRR